MPLDNDEPDELGAAERSGGPALTGPKSRRLPSGRTVLKSAGALIGVLALGGAGLLFLEGTRPEQALPVQKPAPVVRADPISIISAQQMEALRVAAENEKKQQAASATEAPLEKETEAPNPEATAPKEPPNVAGMPVQEAEDALVKAGFVVGSIEFVIVAEAPPGYVVDGSIRPVAPGDTTQMVDLWVSGMPELTGKTFSEASSILKQAGTPVRKVVVIPVGSGQAEGEVVKQVPEPGDAISSIELTVASNTKVAVPVLLGMTREQAVAALEEAGLGMPGVTVAFQAPKAVSPGTVFAQSVEPNILVAPDTVVSLTLLRSETKMPDVRGLLLAQARSLVGKTALVPEVRSGDGPKGVVLSQTPQAGTRVTESTRAVLVVGRG